MKEKPLPLNSTWICGRGNILSGNILLNLVTWYFIITAGNRGTDNGSIRVKSEKNK